MFNWRAFFTVLVGALIIIAALFLLTVLMVWAESAWGAPGVVAVAAALFVAYAVLVGFLDR